MEYFAGEPTLAPGEGVLWSCKANRQQSPSRHVGGRIFLTQDRVIFSPHRLDEVTGGRQWAAEKTDVVSVSTEPARLVLPSPGRMPRMRRRLRIQTRSGPINLFVVNRLDEKVKVLEDWLASQRR